MKQLLLRLQALFLTTIFVAGSFGLPEADVLLDHGVANGPSRPQVHIEGRGGCTDHSDHCVLGRLLADQRDLAPARGSGSALLSVTQSAAYPPADQFTPRRLDLPYHSRAPPTLN